MKHSSRTSSFAAALIALGFSAALPLAAQAQLTYFDPQSGGTGEWNLTVPNWNAGTSTWIQNANALFNGPGSTVTIGYINLTPADNLQIGTLAFGAAAGSYVFDNSSGAQLDFNGGGITTATAAPQTFNSSGDINFNAGASAGTATIQINNSGNLTFAGAGATAGTSTLTNGSTLTFASGSSAGGSSITNLGVMLLNGTSLGGTATVQNGGLLDISGHTGTVTLGPLTNSATIPGPDQLSGAITLGLNKLQLSNGFSLATTPNSGQNLLGYTLDTPSTSGTITLLGGTFTGSDTGRTDITLSSAGPVADGTYVLIDWSAGSASGVDLSDFSIVGGLPPGLSPSSHLAFANGNTQLVLIAVPEPATLAMPLTAILGMVMLRRRLARLAV